MGLWAYIIVLAVGLTVALRLAARLLEGREGSLLRDDRNKVVMSEDSDRRMRAGFEGLNASLPFLGAQSFSPLPPAREDGLETDEGHQVYVEAEPPPPPPAGFIIPE